MAKILSLGIGDEIIKEGDTCDSIFFLQEGSLNVFDISGKQVYSKTIKPGEELSFGDELEAGVYLVKVKQGDRLKVVRLIKH